RDATHGGGWRAAQFGALWVLFVLGPIAVGLVRASGRLPAEPPPLARAILPLAIWAVVLLWMRAQARALPQGYDRRLALSVSGALLALGAAWLGIALLGAPFAAGLLVTPAVLGAMSAGLAVGLDRRFWRLAGVYAVAAPVLAFASRWLLGEVVIGAANGLAFAATMRWMRATRSATRSDGP
ncbi:MAG: hypothetical protein KC613_00345, partial [Myxococcales bacterium]|nr:hypothetical protein [Myxococcales bacterium]